MAIMSCLAVSEGKPAERKEMIDCAPPLPVAPQVKRVGIGRSNVYYAPSSVSDPNLAFMVDLLIAP
jgi:hypothetical protein